MKMLTLDAASISVIYLLALCKRYDDNDVSAIIVQMLALYKCSQYEQQCLGEVWTPGVFCERPYRRDNIL